LKTAIVFDLESLCLEGSQRRFWYAAHDPDPVIAQISAVNLGWKASFRSLAPTRPMSNRSIDLATETAAAG
jgi:hypothetical protein